MKKLFRILLPAVFIFVLYMDLPLYQTIIGIVVFLTMSNKIGRELPIRWQHVLLFFLVVLALNTTYLLVTKADPYTTRNLLTWAFYTIMSIPYYLFFDKKETVEKELIQDTKI